MSAPRKAHDGLAFVLLPVGRGCRAQHSCPIYLEDISRSNRDALPSILGKALTAEIAFGQVLREARRERGLSQEALAAESSVERNYISLLELGRNSVSLRVLFQLAAALQIPPSELVRRAEIRIEA